MIQGGIFYTSSRLVGTIVEDSAEILRNKYTNTIDNVKTKIQDKEEIPQIVWAIGECLLAAVFQFLLNLLFQLDRKSCREFEVTETKFSFLEIKLGFEKRLFESLSKLWKLWI